VGSGVCVAVGSGVCVGGKRRGVAVALGLEGVTVEVEEGSGTAEEAGAVCTTTITGVIVRDGVTTTCLACMDVSAAARILDAMVKGGASAAGTVDTIAATSADATARADGGETSAALCRAFVEGRTALAVSVMPLGPKEVGLGIDIVAPGATMVSRPGVALP